MLKRIQNANRRTIALTTIVLAIALFLAINLITSLTIFGERIDVTENQLYTLTDNTLEVLDEVDEEVTLRLYLSSTLVADDASFRRLADQVTELLRTYEIRSGGNVNFQQFDPVPLSEEEDEVLGYGLPGFDLGNSERGYFGLVGTNTLDDIEVIPFFDPTETAALEYDLTRMVSRLSNREYPAVGVLDGIGVFGTPDSGPSDFIARLQQEFVVEELDLDINNIPPYDAIIVVHPYAMIPQTRYAIEQYVMRGGRALVFLDALSEAGGPAQGGGLRNPDSYLEPVLSGWGLGMNRDQVVGDPELGITVRLSDGRLVERLEQMIVREEGLNRDDIVTAPLSAIGITNPGALYPLDDATTTFTPLITTTEAAGFIPQSSATLRNPLFSLEAFEPAGLQVLAARITGTARTAYPGGPPEQIPNYPTPPPELIEESPEPIDVIVVADTEILSDSHLTGNFAVGSNETFLVNAVEDLVGSDNLTQLRSRQAEVRSFTRIQELDREAQEEYGEARAQLTSELADIAVAIDDLLARTPLGQPTSLPADLRAQYDTLVARQVEARGELRDIEAAIQAEFDNLRTRLILLNILVIPAAVIVLGLLVAAWRRMRLSRYLARRQAAA